MSDTDQYALLKVFIDMCLKQPSILHQPELKFVKSFIEHFGGKVPESKAGDVPSQKPESEKDAKESESKTKPEADPEEEDSDVEFDMTGVIEPDTDDPQEMGDPNREPTEDDITESENNRLQASAAFIEKDYEKAIEHYTKAILLNPQASLLFTKRGQIFYLLNKPNACIRDCNRSLELNPDSASAHKYRGRAHQLLGNWEEAVNDLRLACKYDFDEEADKWLHEATPNALKQRQKMKKKESKKQAKMEKEKEEGAKKTTFSDYRSDPDVLKAFEDPEIVKAFQDISQNPPNFFKYRNNPKVMAFINKMVSKYGGASGMPGFPGAGGIPGFPGAGGMPGFPGAGGIPGFPGAGGMPSFPGAGGMPTFPGSMPTNTPKATPKDDGDLD